MGRSKTGKLAKQKPQGSRRISPPSVKDDIPPEQQSPVFCLEHLQDEYCVTRCQLSDQASLSKKLKTLSRLTWAQLRSSSKHAVGYEKLDRKAIKASIPSHITEDVKIIAFRFSGKKPMVGYRSGRIFHIVWLDRNFSLYDHGS